MAQPQRKFVPPLHAHYYSTSVPVNWPTGDLNDGDIFAYLCPFTGLDWVYFQWRDDLLGWSYLGTDR